MGLFTLLVFLFFSNTLDVFDITTLFDNFPCRLIVIALIQAKMLRLFLGGFRTFHHDSIQGRCQKQMVVRIGACYTDSKWTAVFLDKQALLDAQFSTVAGVRADAFALVVRFAFAPFLPMNRALFRHPSADCHSQ